MKLIDTSGISSTVGYPGLANVGGQSVGNSPLHMPGDPTKFQGLDFLQQALLDMIDALCRAFIIDPTVATVISYIPFSGGGFMEAGFATPSYVYYRGELFFVPSYSLVALEGGYQIANINPNPTDNGVTAPVTTFSDGSTGSIHNQRTITVTWVTSGSGDFPNPGTWQNLSNNAVWSAAVSKGIVVPITYKNGYSSLEYTSSNASTYRKDGMGTVYISAYFSSPGTITSKVIATLPTGYAPLNPRNFFLWEQTGGTVCVITIDTSGNISAQTLMGGNVPGSDTFSFEAIYNVMDA